MDSDAFRDYLEELAVISEVVAEFLEAYKALIASAAEELIASVVEAGAAEGPADEINPQHHTRDFSCSCRHCLRLDRIPWYTSGFQ